jgi:hypothetical protein
MIDYGVKKVHFNSYKSIEIILFRSILLKIFVKIENTEYFQSMLASNIFQKSIFAFSNKQKLVFQEKIKSTEKS